MLCFFRALAVIIMSVSLFAQSSAPSATKASDDAVSLCAVAGRIVTAADGSPLKSARVALLPEHSHSDKEIYATTSDADGRFILKDVPPGRYEFLASHTGFVRQYYKAKGDDEGVMLSLKAAEKVSDVIFRLKLAAVITGRVSNEDGEAMQRMQVVALRQPDDEEEDDEDPSPRRKQELEQVSSAQTDDRGQYRVFGLKPGEYYIRVDDSFQPLYGGLVEDDYWLKEKLGSEYASVYYPGVKEVAQAQVIPVKAGDEVQANVIMRRVKTVEVAGRVIDASGPAANASVSLEPVEENYSAFDRQDTTDEKGNFRLKGVPEGSYFVNVHKRSDGGLVLESWARQRIEVNGENVESLTIVLGGGATIQGKLAVNGPASAILDRINVALITIDEHEQSVESSRVKKDGTFEMKSVPDGNYAVNIWGLENDTYVKAVRHGADDVLEKGLRVGNGSGGKLEVVLSSDGAQLEGSVSDDDGVVIGARVRVVPDPLTPYNRFRSHRTSTDQRGHFLLIGLTPGKYRVSARSPLSSDTSSSKSEPQPVTLSENDHKTIDLKIVKPQD